MSEQEHTPSTEQVRMAWQRNVLGEPEAVPVRVQVETAAEFDRWLAAHDAEVAERIAQAIERVADASGRLGGLSAYLYGLEHATRIAREVGRG